MVGQLYPLVNQAQLLTNVGLWTDGFHRANLVLATVAGAKDSWAVITDEIPSLQTLRRINLVFSHQYYYLQLLSTTHSIKDLSGSQLFMSQKILTTLSVE